MVRLACSKLGMKLTILLCDIVHTIILLNNYKEVKDDIFQRQIASIRVDTDRSVTAYKTGKIRAQAVVDGSRKTQQEVQSDAVQGKYNNGDVVSYIRGDGSVGYALITNDGVFF
jgi:hypothetical protein